LREVIEGKTGEGQSRAEEQKGKGADLNRGISPEVPQGEESPEAFMEGH